MSRYKTERAALRGQITKLNDEVARLVDVHELSRIEQFMKKVKRIETRVLELNDLIRDAFPEDNFEQLFAADRTDIERYEAIIESIILFCDKKLSEIGRNTGQITNGQPQVVRTGAPRLKAPNCPLPNYDDSQGSMALQKFFSELDEIFKKFDHSDYEQYIIFKPLIKGRGAKLIESLSTTDQSYLKAKKLILDAFANPKALKFECIDRLFKFKRANHPDAYNFATEIKLIYEEVQFQKVELEDVLQYCFLGGMNESLKSCVVQITNQNFPSTEEILKNIFSAIERSEICSTKVTTKSDAGKIKKPDNHKPAYKSDFKKNELKSTDVTNLVVETEKQSPKNRKPKFTKRETKCIFCENYHHSSRCEKYSTLAARKKRITDMNKCTRCLKSSHLVENCTTSMSNCFLCDQDHHLFYCENNKSQDSAQISVAVQKGETNIATVVPTATINIYTDIGMQKIRCLFDQCAQKTLITREIAQNFGLTPSGQVRLSISGLYSTEKRIYDVVRILIKANCGDILIDAVVVDTLPESIRINRIGQVVNKLKLKNKDLADPNIEGDIIDNIKFLIGADHYYKFFITEDTDDVKLLNTKVGKVISGAYNINSIPEIDSAVCDSVLISRIAVQNNVPDINDTEIVTNLWDLDYIGISDSKLSFEDDIAIKNFESSIEFTDDRYVVRLPWKNNHSSLPNNFKQCIGRLKSTLNSLSRVEGNTELYDSIIKDQLKQGFIEHVPKGPNIDCHYLPHHAVVKDSATTPIRIVHDCSAKASVFTPSLNDCLLSGPNLTEELVSSLLKFKTNEFAFVADISRAFLRVGLNVSDRDYTRFIWYKNPTKPELGFDIYRFRSVLFGSKSSSFLLQACLRHHFGKYDDPVAAKISKGFYVDNLQLTFSSLAEMYEAYTKSLEIMYAAGMPMQEYVSNYQSLNNLSIRANRGINPEAEKTKVLGLDWEFKSDTLYIRINEFLGDEIPTKRIFLGEISKTFDPLGHISPLTIKSKLLMQQLWTLKLKWEDKIPNEIFAEWIKIRNNITKSKDICFPRYVANSTEPCSLHVFCDAAKYAYGCVAYIISQGKSNIVMSKSRVAPLRKKDLAENRAREINVSDDDDNDKTIPKLELTAYLLGARLAKYIKSTLSDIQFNKTILWSDSEITLLWTIHRKSNDVYVKNRVNDIHACGKFEFRYCNTKQNPADMISRGVSHRQFVNSTWFNGPVWLTNRDEWPELLEKFHTYEQIDVNAVITSDEVTEPEPKPEYPFKLEKYSSLLKIYRVFRIVFKFIISMKTRVNKPHNLSVKNAGVLAKLLRVDQNFYFKSLLKERKLENNTKIYHIDLLNLFYDDKGLLRCYSRLGNANLNEDAQYPILLARKSYLTEKIIENFHLKVLHGGVQDTLAKLREQFWIQKYRSTVKNFVSQCYVCRRLNSAHLKLPIPPNLTENRVNCQLRPFESSGVDLTGNIILLDKDKNVNKYYIVLFTCTVFRSVHLEVVSDLTAEAFINAFRKFNARRGNCRYMLSDNASNLKSGAKFLKDICNLPDVKYFLEVADCEWKFIPARSPHFGGFYERLIGVVKSSLRKVLFKRQITFDELLTLVAEIEMKVNNRPLTYIDSELTQCEPLTPSHLMYGYRLNSNLSDITLEYISNPDLITEKDLNERFVYLNEIIHKFKTVWKKEYLGSLLDRAQTRKLNNPNGYLKIGDVYLIHDDCPRSMWKLGKVVELFPGSDGLIRVVKLKTQNGMTTRSINKIYPLEVVKPTTIPNPAISGNSANPANPVVDANSSEPARSGNSARPVLNDITAEPVPNNNTTVVPNARPVRKAAQQSRRNWQSLNETSSI